MPTANQLIKSKRKKALKKRKSPALRSSPQKRGTVVLVTVRNPKKPNSANRAVAKVRLTTGQVVQAYIPGEGLARHVQEHSVVLIKGGGPKDLVGVKYTIVPNGHSFIPGANGSGTKDAVLRQQSRSKYGVKKQR